MFDPGPLRPWRSSRRPRSSILKTLLPVRVGGLGLINPSDSAEAEYSESIRVSASLVSKNRGAIT